MSAIEINADRLAAAATCRSAEATRYYLGGVLVTPAADPATGRGVLLVATDGYRMALIWDMDGKADKPRILAFDPKHKALKCGRGEDARVMHLSEIAPGKSGAASICDGYSETAGQNPRTLDVMPVTEIAATFPDWTRVLPPTPKEEGTAVYSGNFFNPDYLASFGAAFRRISGARTELFSLSQPKRGGAAWVWSTNVAHARFIIMPARVEAHPGTRPFWVDLATGVADA